MGEKTRHPIVSGLVALAVVTAVVGGLLGAAALAGTRVLGLSGGETAATTATAEESLSIPPLTQPAAPRPSTAPRQSAPPGRGQSTGPAEPADFAIELEADQDAVESDGKIELSGTYRGGAGATLQVQRRQGGDGWEDFPVDISVDDGPDFDTTVQTSRTGVNEWRVVDTDSDARSNVVRVRVG